MNRTLLMLMSRPAGVPAAVTSQFAQGEKGGIWIPSVRKSLFQDSAMTIAASVGGTVAKMLDLSGNGNTVTFSNVTLQQDAAGKLYLAANGTSSSGSTAAIDFTGTSNMTVHVGATKSSDAASAALIELSATSSTNAGTFAIFAPLTPASTDIVFRGGSTSAPGQGATKTGLTAPYTAVMTGKSHLGALVELRLNGASAATAAGNSSGAFGNYQLFMLARATSSLFFNGRFYGAIVRGAASSAGQIVDAETYLNRVTGAY
jgi:hypothetical protein